MKNKKYIEYQVVKRGEKKEPFDFDKIYKHMLWAAKGRNVNVNDLIEKFRIRLQPVMRSDEIQQSLIFASADLISKEEPDWQYVTSALMLQDLYKEIYGSYIPSFDYKTLKKRIKKGYYDKEILKYYTKSEFNEFCKLIDFNNDYKFTYLGINQMIKKYSIKRKNKPIETPQEIFLLIPMYIFARIKDKKIRKEMISSYYQGLSSFDLFLSTPPMIGIRTNMRGFTSCAGVHYGDSIESFGNASKTIFKLITKLRAGVGANPGFIRGMDADIGDGDEVHTGVVPYLKVFESISRSSTQPNSGRSGAITNYYPFFHWEIEDILTLKNNKGSDETSVRFSDHAIVFNDYFYEKVKNNENIYLFHMNDVKDLYENIGMDDFQEKYEKLIQDKNIKKKEISAKYIRDKYFNERYITSRIYKTNANEMQRHGAFDLPNSTSNLCTEINLPSFPDEPFFYKVNNKKEMKNFINDLYIKGKWYQLYKFIYYKIIDNQNEEIVKQFQSMLNKDGKKIELNFGETFSCILGGVNFGNLPHDKIERRKKMETMMKNQVYFLDEMIDYQDYAGIKTFERFTKNRRALGISPGNLFYLLAQYGYDYDSQEARELINEIMEEMLYYGIKASMELAKEKGKCKWFADTKYSKGIFPIDTYNKNVDRLCSSETQLNWKWLKEQVLKNGMRNSTILTAVPSSNSSRPANMISGINPHQSLEYNIEDQKMKITGIVPDVEKYTDFYERQTAWKIDVIEYWKLIAIFQKWIDQSISLNEYVDFSNYKNMKIPKSEILKRDLFTLMFGIKSLYYAKTKTDVDDETLFEKEAEACGSGGCTL